MSDTAPFPEATPFVIDLHVPGSDPFLQLVRSVVGRAAGMAGFTFDGIEDFALAVDEAATILVRIEPATLRVTLSGIEHGDIVAKLDIGTMDGWPPRHLEDDTGWQVLTALCDRVWVLHGTDGSGIGLSQQRR